MKKNRKRQSIPYWVLVVCVFGVASIVCVRYCYVAQPPRQGESVIDYTAYLDRQITRLMRSFDIPGVTVALIHENNMVWSQAYGYADIEEKRTMSVDTICKVESISKSVTAWGVMKLAEQGVISIDKPFTYYVKNWDIPDSSFSFDQITIRQLLSHSSGMPLGTIGLEYSPIGESIPSLEESLAQEAILKRAPGSTFAYSNVGFNLLELLIQEVTGISFSHYMKQEILEPLGMNTASFDWSEDMFPPVPTGYDLTGRAIPPYVYAEKASGGLFASVEDIAQFIIAAMIITPTQENRVLNETTIAQLYTPVIRIGGMYGVVADSYGLGYFIDHSSDGKTSVFHGGQGHGWMTHAHYFPFEGEGIVILTNSQRSWPLISYVLRDWSKWALSTDVGMGIIVLGLVGMWVIIGIIALISIYLGWITVKGLMQKGHVPIHKKTALFVCLQLGVSGALLSSVIWSINQPYLFISSLFPLAYDWLLYAIIVLAVVLICSALFPLFFGKRDTMREE